MSRTFAYCRVSTTDQTTDNQVMEIAAAGLGMPDWLVRFRIFPSSYLVPIPPNTHPHLIGWGLYVFGFIQIQIHCIYSLYPLYYVAFSKIHTS